MSRYTKPLDNDNSYVVCEDMVKHVADGYTGEAVERLAKFENIYDNLKTRQAEISIELEKLKSEEKLKSVKFKQLLVEKITNNNIIILLETYGLK